MELKLDRYSESNLKGNGTYKNLLEICSEVQNIVDDDEFMKENWMNIVYLTHSTFKRKTEKTNEKTTNAYWKMTEIWNHFKFSFSEIRHFDIACAPGFFIFAVRRIAQKNNIKYSFNGFTLKPKSLSDESSEGNSSGNDENVSEESENEEGLELDEELKNNPNIFYHDILEGDIDSKYFRKFNLVTGDIGIKCNYEEIEELQLIELERRQMETALKLVENGGCVVLKMFTYSQKETIRLVDHFAKFFDVSYIYKPFSSRVLNNESYLIGIHFDEFYATEGVGSNAEQIKYFEEQRQKYRKDLLNAATLLTKLKKAQYEVSKFL